MWLPVLHLRVLRTRPVRSARLYGKIWRDDGSPLATITGAQAAALQQRLDREWPGATRVLVGMRYGQPSIRTAVEELLRLGCDRVLAVPMYPQYASATTGSSLEALFRTVTPRRVIPSVRVVPPYFNDAGYISSLAAVTRAALVDWEPEHVILSFHGLPRRYAAAGDPYPEHCLATAEALTAEMRWSPSLVTTSFQSRFGREEWLRPYTDETLQALGRRKARRVAALCPGFTADCLETLEEMGLTNAELFQAAGGADYRLVPCLNTHPAWIDALTALASRELSGWLPAPQLSGDVSTRSRDRSDAQASRYGIPFDGQL
jgi:ferrochelatase